MLCRMRNHRRWFLGALAALALVPVTLTAPAALAQSTPLQLTLPAPTGRYPVGTIELHLVDHDRPDPLVPERTRELMVSLWYPARPGGDAPPAPYLPPLAARRFGERTDALLGLAEGRVDWTGITSHARVGVPVAHGRRRGLPVLLFSPGAEELRASGTMLVEELASRGYLVVAIDHTYEAREVEFPGGRLLTQQLPDLPPRELLRLLIRTRVQDTSFVLDQLTVLARGGNPDAGRRPLPRGLPTGLDLSRVGMYGHSGGGFTTAEAMLVDRRLAAGANLDGSMIYSVQSSEYGDVVAQGLDRPFLLMGAGLTLGEPHTHEYAVEWQRFWDNSTGWRLDLYVPDGEHFTFTDHQVFLPQLERAVDLPPGLVTEVIGTVAPDRIVGSLRAYLAAFFDQHLRHRPQHLLAGPSPAHPDVTFVR